MHIMSTNMMNNNNRQNFTAVRFPEKKQIIEKMGEELGNRLLEKKPEIEEVSKEMKTDFEVTLDTIGYLNVYAGKMLKKPWQTTSNDLPQYIGPEGAGHWTRTDYNLKLGEDEIIPDTIVDRCVKLADVYNYKMANGLSHDSRVNF